MNAALVLLTDIDDVPVRRQGIDEQRYRSVRYFRDPDGSWLRFEPWMNTLVDIATGQALGVVDGRDSAGVGDWLRGRSPAWRERAEVVAMGIPEADRLYETIGTWWETIEVLIITSATNTKVEAADTTIKNIKRSGRGFQKNYTYRTRILLLSAARVVP